MKDQGKLDEAVACYRRALELKPDFAEAHGNLGSALEEIGDLQGAEDSFRAALRHDSRFAFAHYKLAELLGGKLPEEDLAAQRRLLEQGLPPASKGVDGRATIVVALRPGPGPGRAGRVCRGRRAPRSGQRPATVRVAQARPGVRPERARVARHPDDRGLHAGFLRAGPRLRVAGKRAPGVRRGAAAVRHDAHRADPGRPFPGLRRGGDQTGRRHHGRARRTRRRLHRGPSPLGPRDGPPSRFAALGETSRIAVPRRFASWTRCRTTTCFSVCWRASFRGRSSSIAAAICATWPSPVG